MTSAITDWKPEARRVPRATKLKDGHALKVDLPREFKLVAACCVWPPSNRRDAAIRDAAAAPIDWARVLRVARRQRVEGLVRAGLVHAGVEPPAATADELGDLAQDVARRSLTSAAEAANLQRALQAGGVSALVLKGAAVEVLAYGRLGLKNAWDIDLMVAPAVVEVAIERLTQLGYDLVTPANLTPLQFQTWVRLAKECELRHRVSGQNLELHWRLTDGPSLLAGITAAAPSQDVPINQTTSLRTLGRDELFSYLCVHGAMHGWSRLKWLADLAALLAGQDADALAHSHRRAQELGAGLCSAQALLLCRQVLGLRLTPDFEAELAKSATVRWLVAVALKTMAGGAEAEIDKRPFVASRILLSQLFLGGDLRHAMVELRYRSISIQDRIHVPLPRGLHVLYPILRLPLWLSRRMKRVRRG